MAEFDFGLPLGLSVDMQYDKRINDLRYDEQALAGIKARNEAKRNLFLDDIDYQNAQNSFDNPIIKEKMKNKLYDLGRFINQNPDWSTNVDKLMQVKEMKRSFKDDPDLIRGLATDNQYKELVKDMQEASKNPYYKDLEGYENQLQQFKNYFATGNKNGVKGTIDAPIYVRPQDLIDVPDTLLKAGKNINNFDVHKGENLGEYLTVPKPQEVEAIKNSIKQQHGRSIELQARKLGFTTPEQIDKWLTDGIVAGFEPKYSPGDPNALWERGMRVAELKAKQGANQPVSGVTPYDALFDPRKPSGNAPAEISLKAFGNTPPIKIVGNRGGVANLTGQEMVYDGRYVTDSMGRRYLTGFVNVPLEVAKQTGIWSGDDEDGGISPEYLGKGVRRTKDTKDGPKTYIKMDYMMPIDQNDLTTRQYYNTHAQPSKLTGPIEGSTQQAVSGTRQEFINAGYSDAQIQEGVNRGLINLK